MDCRLLGTKPSPEPMLVYYHNDNDIWVKLQNVGIKNMYSKVSVKRPTFCLSLIVFELFPPSWRIRTGSYLLGAKPLHKKQY